MIDVKGQWLSNPRIRSCADVALVIQANLNQSSPKHVGLCSGKAGVPLYEDHVSGESLLAGAFAKAGTEKVRCVKFHSLNAPADVKVGTASWLDAKGSHNASDSYRLGDGGG